MSQSDWRLRAEIHARQKNWEAAADDVREFLLLNPNKHWLTVSSCVAGPYPDDPKASYPPEKPFELAQVASGDGGAETLPEVRWQSVPLNANGFIDFGALFDDAEHISAYALIRVFSPDQRPVAILFGADDEVRLWLNGKLIRERVQLPALAPDSDATPATLVAGWNTVLARVMNTTRHHALYLRLSDTPADMFRANEAAKD